MIWKNRWKKMGKMGKMEKINFQIKMIKTKVNKAINKNNRRRRKILAKAKRTTQRIASNNL